MKNVHFILLIINFLIANYAIGQATPRKVSWVHGFGGNHCSLSLLEEPVTNKYLVESIRANYDTQKGIVQSGIEIRKQLLPFYLPADDRNLAIGHSMGGLNLRQTELNEEPLPLGGIITIGTPHRGAHFAASYFNGDLDQFISSMTGALLAGPKRDPYASLFLYKLNYQTDLPLINVLKKDQMGLTDLIGLFGKGKTFDFLGQLLDSEQSIRDLSPGSGALASLNQQVSNRKAYLFWGEEDAPVHWRFLSSLLYSTCDGNVTGPTDELLLPVVKRMRDVYAGLEIANRVICDIGYLISLGLGDKQEMSMCILANKYHLGKQWIDQSENEWSKLTGALSKVKRKVVRSRFLCADKLEEARRAHRFEEVKLLMTDESCWEVVIEEEEVWDIQPSDGLVTKSSAIGLSNADAVIGISGANHFELLYDPAVLNALKGLFSENGEWSYIEEK